VLILGLDMGDGALIRHWGEQGRLPYFASRMAQGTWLDLDSPAQVLHTSTWPTFATGTQPGRHGVYYPYQPKPGYQQAQHIQPDQYGLPSFWQLAAAEGCRCVVYDIPETFPAPRFRGQAIFEWGTWAWYGTPTSQPTTLLNELKARFGRYPLGMEAKRLGLRVPKSGLLEKRLLRSVAYKQTTAQWLLEQDTWDLAVIGFCETHPAGHYLWPATADTVRGTETALFQALFNVYAAIDRALEALCRSIPDDVTVLILSGDGVRPNRCGWHLLPAVLERLGYTRPPSGGMAEQDAAPSPSLLGRVKQFLPASARRWIADSLPWWLRDQLGARLQAAAIDWSQTRAFTLPTDLEGCIRINLRGREPQGIVEPGAQYTALCQEIQEHLEALINPANGARAVRRVWLRDEVFPGPLQEHLPDIIVTWNDEVPIAALTSPRLGLIEAVSPDRRTGTHSPDSFLLAVGAGIPEGQRGRGQLLDVAPTVLSLLGLDPKRASMDGQPLPMLTSTLR
jgi:predicted AlkP superfamily phosphohydrolase/phosphomutase